MAKIIVIGAGIAGLAAAKNLAPHHEVIVLEARNRVGGRIYTDYSHGFPLEIGAGWIHGLENNPIASLAHQFQVQYAFFGTSKKLIFDHHQKIVSETEVNDILEKSEIIQQKAAKYIAEAKNDLTLTALLNQFLDEKTKQSPVWEWVHKFFGYYSGLEAARMSAKYFYESGAIGENYIILNGYDKIPQGLATNLNIQFNTIVSHIDYRQKEIAITTNQGIFEADKVIVTLPLGVLKKESVTFNPPLPNEKQSAINHLTMGFLNRIILRFPKTFWPKDYSGIYVLENKSPAIEFYLNLDAFLHEPILTAFTAGTDSQTLENLSDDDLIALALENLRKAFGHIPTPQKLFISRWGKDPFSVGSYSVVPIHASGDDYDALATSVNEQLFFAGEATHRAFAATTQGAYLSGIRASEDLMRSI